MDGDPAPSFDPTVRGEGPVGGGEAAAEGGGGDQVEVVGEGHQVEVGGGQRDELGERPRSAETGLPLLRTDLRVTGRAVGATAAAAHERDGDPFTHPPVVDLRADGSDDTGALQAYLRNIRLGLYQKAQSVVLGVKNG